MKKFYAGFVIVNVALGGKYQVSCLSILDTTPQLTGKQLVLLHILPLKSIRAQP